MVAWAGMVRRMDDLHPKLRAQLGQHGLTDRSGPDDTVAWQAFLDAVSRAYASDDAARFQVERAMEHSASEMEALHSRLRAQNEDLARKTRSLEREIRRREKIEQELRHEASHDPLTHLPNRAMVMDEIERRRARCASGEEAPFGLLFLDIDNFKDVNDTLGHDAGDEMLTIVGRRLERCIRELDSVGRNEAGLTGRFGGDEFVVILDDVADADDAVHIADRVREAIGQPMTVLGHPMEVQVSVGVTLSTGADRCAEGLLREADTAMYFAKHSGKGRCAVFDERMQHAAATRTDLEHQLRGAVSESQFELHYQPIVDLRTGRFTRVEALLRWRQDDGALIAPGAFLAVAEEMGLISEMGDWVIDEACRQVSEWNETLRDRAPLAVNVNISPRQFADGDLAAAVGEALARWRLDPARLCLEIHESVLMTETARSVAMLDNLRRLGVSVMLDDFGAGHSSLGCLHHFAVDGLKIDRGFMTSLAHNRRYAAVVDTIVQLAHVLDKKITCEGIENPEQIALVLALNCDYGQGFLFSPPLPACDLELLFDTKEPLWLADADAA